MRRFGVTIGCSLVLLAGCGESTIKTDATEQTVTRFVAKQTGYRPTDVRCPSGESAEVGVKFQCHFTGPDGPYTAYLRVLSVDGEKAVFRIATRPAG